MIFDLLIASAFCIGGVILLVKSADIMIEGALVIAHRFTVEQNVNWFYFISFWHFGT